MLSKKDCEAIAGILRARGGDSTLPVASIMDGLATYMEQDNPRFDRARFLAACRGEDSKDSAGRKVRYSLPACCQYHESHAGTCRHSFDGCRTPGCIVCESIRAERKAEARHAR